MKNKRIMHTALVVACACFVQTSVQAEIDPEHIGDTLTGTNHVTYSSSDPGDATGSVIVDNPDGSTQTIYYTYTMPEDYSIVTAATTATNEDITDKMFTGWRNAGSILKISGKSLKLDSDFTDNANYWGNGGAINISANSNIAEINGDFVKNRVSQSQQGQGGAIVVNNSSIGTINGDFVENYVKSTGSFTYGGAISLTNSSIENINANFINNYIEGKSFSGGGVLKLEDSSSIKNIKGAFINNHVINHTNYWAKGGAIFIYSGCNIKNINADFYNNYALSEANYAQGGAISIEGGGSVDEITGNFVNNGVITLANKNSYGGAIKNGGTIGTIIDDKLTSGIENSNFYYNYVKSESGTVQGGAIFTFSDLNIIADNGTSVFQGNYIQVGDGEKDYQAIWVGGETTKLNLQQFNGGKMYMYDNINGTDGYTVNIQGDGTGTYYMFNDIKNANVSFDNTTINTVNNDIHTYEFNSLALNSNTNFVADVDLVNETMDRITSENITVADGAKLIVSDMNLLNDAEKDSTKIFFAEEGLAQNVDTTVTQVAYSPIYKYDVDYVIDENDNQGYFTFARHATPTPGPTPGPSPDDFNPAVLSTPAMTQAGLQATMNMTMNYAFQHSDGFTKQNRMDRFAAINANKYAMANVITRSDSDVVISSDDAIATPSARNDRLALSEAASTDFNQNMANLRETYENKGAWVRPYASFENIPIKNGPRVDTISYGTLVGFDTDFKELRHGWDTVFTGYLGYNGAHLTYQGVSTTMNGGILGGTQTWYKGNFWTALTATTGASVAESSTMYGHESNASIMAGVGSKTGYNFEFKEGRFIIQPIWFMNYSMMKTFDYTNAAGVRIDSDPLHTIQLNPSVRFIGNLNHGWQPYASVGMVWNLMNETKVKAAGVKLPEMSIKPYVEYGVGVQKQIGDRFTGFFQAMMRNGGRNGIALTGGFRWALGKDKSKEKVHNDKEILKQVRNDNKQVKKDNKKVLKRLSMLN